MENIITTIQGYIQPELLILVPVLWFVGLGFKYWKKFDNKFIPVVLGAIGIVLALLYTMAHTDALTFHTACLVVFTSIVQGILCAGGAVYIDQLYKQAHK